jgi:hypothetical protein
MKDLTTVETALGLTTPKSKSVSCVETETPFLSLWADWRASAVLNPALRQCAFPATWESQFPAGMSRWQTSQNWSEDMVEQA